VKNIQTIRLYLKRTTSAGLAAQLFLALLFVAIAPFGQAHAAAGLLTTRSIQMNDSGPSANSSITSGVGSGTKVIYKVTFTPTSAGTVGGIAIDFCSNSPLMFEACTAPTGLNTNYATTALYNATNVGGTAFAVYTGATSQIANRIVLTRTTAAAFTGGALSFELGNGVNGITNPSTTGTFYARIHTYDTEAHAQAHVPAPAAPATEETFLRDFGGVAMSTATVITITARVQENLVFCVSAAAPTANCGGTTAPAVTLGHGTATKAIDSSTVDEAVIYSQLSTNAGSGAIVRIKNGNSTCGGLSVNGGATCGIPPANSGANTTPTAMTAGTAGFGLAITAGAGLTTAAPYNGVVASDQFGMDSTTSTNNVTTGYGSQAISSAGPVGNINSTWTFAATASPTTPAGIYTANMAAIATGVF